MVRGLRRRRKSAGVVVSEPAYQAISLGNAARSAREWAAAATAYRDAVTIEPGLAHVWIQLGHMLKETGDLNGASEAYATADALSATDVEAAVRRGEIAQRLGRGREALNFYLDALRRDPLAPDAILALTDILERSSGLTRDVIISALDELGLVDDEPASPRQNARAAIEAALQSARAARLPAGQIAALEQALRADTEEPDAGAENAANPVIVFDASDLLSYFNNARLPTGIQRVQIATISSALMDPARGEVLICSFSETSDCWTEIPADRFLDLCELAVESGERSDPVWLRALATVKILTSVASPLEFPEGALLVNLGTSWWLQNYFLYVREAQRTRGIRYIPFVHDFIPVMTPEHCVRELTEDFITWALGAFQHADFFLVNSEATKRDLLKVGRLLGHKVDPASVATIRLDADFRRENVPAAPVTRLRDWDLRPGRFVLIVGTIESRKNHVGALDAWLELIQQHGIARVPKLVCVGNRGWLNDAVYDRLQASSILRHHVVMLSGLSDGELALLYGTCRFTLYPSSYEGWGLPVTESLCYGKVPLVSDSSSLPEAGGDFAVYFASGSTPEIVAAAERLILDDEELQRREAKIADEFHPRSWDDIARQITAEIRQLHDQAGETDATHEARFPRIQLGRYYPITRSRSTRIWRGLSSAEVLRTGTGWWHPDDWGCWTKPGGGELTLRLPAGTEAVRLYLRLQAPDVDGDFTLSFGEGAPPIVGSLRAGQGCWRAVTLPAGSDNTVYIQVRGSASIDLTERTGGLDKRVTALGVAGIYVCAADDMAARADLGEAIAFDALGDLAFNSDRYAVPVDLT